MKQRLKMACCGLVLAPSLCVAQNVFDGTWRPDPQKPSPNQPPDEVILMSGQYECQSCKPPYKIGADGQDHEVKSSPYYDSLSVSIVDEHTVIKTAKKGGMTVGSIKEIVSADGSSRTQVQTVMGMAPRTFDFARTFSRIAAGPSGSHALSGTWRELEADLVNHEEDTTYKVSNKTLRMSDAFGRSFSAKLDGTEAPYKGDPNFTDGKTMHVRFDDTQGHIQEQDGHRVP